MPRRRAAGRADRRTGRLSRPGRFRASLHRHPRRGPHCRRRLSDRRAAGTCTRGGFDVSYVKPHGALYNTVVSNHEQARAVAAAVHAGGPRTAGTGPVGVGHVSTRRPSVGCVVWQRLSRIAPTSPTANLCRVANQARCCTIPTKSPSEWPQWSLVAKSPRSTARWCR